MLRRMHRGDVPAVMDVQEPASVAGLSGVFLQLGWVDTGERSRGPMPPHAELLTYAYRPGSSGTGPTVAP